MTPPFQMVFRNITVKDHCSSDAGNSKGCKALISANLAEKSNLPPHKKGSDRRVKKQECERCDAEIAPDYPTKQFTDMSSGQ